MEVVFASNGDADYINGADSFGTMYKVKTSFGTDPPTATISVLYDGDYDLNCSHVLSLDVQAHGINDQPGLSSRIKNNNLIEGGQLLALVTWNDPPPTNPPTDPPLTAPIKDPCLVADCNLLFGLLPGGRQLHFDFLGFCVPWCTESNLAGLLQMFGWKCGTC